MKKKIISMGISTIIAANMCAPTALHIFADDLVTQTDEVLGDIEESVDMEQQNTLPSDSDLVQDNNIENNEENLDNSNEENQEENNQQIETSIEFDGGLSRIYDGNEQVLNYSILDNEGNVIESKNVEFKKKFIGIWITIKPKEVGNYNFTVEYKGDAQHKPLTYEGIFEIYDKRKAVDIVFEGTQTVYNGEKQNVVAKAYDAETGEEVKEYDATTGEEKEVKVDIKFNSSVEDWLTGGTARDAGVHTFTATYSGNKDYEKKQVKGELEILKCTPQVIVENKNTKYTGQPIKTNVIVEPNCGYINLYTGINANIKAKVLVDLNLGDDVISKLIKDIVSKLNVQNMGDFKNALKSLENALSSLGVDVTEIIKVLDYIPDDLSVGFGTPVDAGAYLSTAVVLDKNANITAGVGILLINRQYKEVIFTENSLPDRSYIKPGTEYTHEAIYESTTSKAKIMYTGIILSGKAYFSEVQPTEQGVYAAVAYSYNDPGYTLGLAARTFTIVKDLSFVDITSNKEVLYSGQPYKPSSVVKDSKGNIIEDANVEYTYYQGKNKLDSAPKEVGNYTVMATYYSSNQYVRSDDLMNFKITKAPLAVKVDNIEKIQGQEDPTLTYTTHVLATGDDIEFNLYREQGEAVGNYAIKVEEQTLKNYNMVTVEGIFTIKPINSSIINQVPTISGIDDVTIKVGAKFDKLAGVKAMDKEDGDITSRIEVTGDVDTSKEGKYVLTYKVVDNQGASNTITRNVTVEKATTGGGSTGGGSITTPSKPEIIDINNHWANKEIQSFIDKGYIDGYGDKTFRPEGLTTRAEFVKTVNKVFNLTNKGNENFTDVSSNDWFYDNVCIGVKAGYIDGYGDNTFRPNDYISREEAAKIIAKLANLKGDGKIEFIDKSQISTWAKEYVDALSGNKIINGYPEDNTFRPQNKIKRSEAVAMLYRLNK